MKLLRGEYTEAKATSKMIPSFWGFVNIVYGGSTSARLLVLAFSVPIFACSGGAAIAKPND